jgi:hypothetical protein
MRACVLNVQGWLAWALRRVVLSRLLAAKGGADRVKTAALFARTQPEMQSRVRQPRWLQGLVVGQAKRDGLKFGREFEVKQT